MFCALVLSLTCENMQKPHGCFAPSECMPEHGEARGRCPTGQGYTAHAPSLLAIALLLQALGTVDWSRQPRTAAGPNFRLSDIGALPAERVHPFGAPSILSVRQRMQSPGALQLVDGPSLSRCCLQDIILCCAPLILTRTRPTGCERAVDPPRLEEASETVTGRWCF